MSYSKDQLKLDRRLLRRPGWITSHELEESLQNLPDVGDKATFGEDEENSEEAQTQAEAEPHFQ